MKQDNYYSQENHGPYQLFSIGDFPLEDGGIIEHCEIAYSTFGKLNALKDNAILITTWYSGTSRIMEQVYVGAGRAIDPAKYFIIIINQIGNGLSTSPHNAGDSLRGPKFPRVRIADDVRAQHKLLTEQFGIETLALVTGGSMGAQQTWEWAVRYPEMVKRAAPIAGRATRSSHSFLFTEALIYSLTSDPSWNRGLYIDPKAVADGLRHHADLLSVMGFSVEFFRQALYTNIGFPTLEDFRSGFTHNYFLPMDPNNLLCTFSPRTSNLFSLTSAIKRGHHLRYWSSSSKSLFSILFHHRRINIFLSISYPCVRRAKVTSGRSCSATAFII